MSQKTRDEVRAEASATIQGLVGLLHREGLGATAVVGIHAKATRPIGKWVRKLEMDVALARRMSESVLQPISAALDWIAQDLLQPFDHRPPQGQEIICLRKSEFSVIGEWLDALPAPGVWDVFVRDQWIQRNISGVFTVIQFPSGAPPIIAFTKWNETLLMKRRGLTAMFSDNRFTLEDTKQAIYLPERIDFFSYGDIMFVINWDGLEKAVSFRDVTKTTANKNWSKFQVDVPLESPDGVWAAIEKSVRHQNTINRAFANPGRVAPSIERVTQFIAEPELSIKVDGGKLIVDASSREQVIHLMTIIADGYVTSDLTDRRLRAMDAEEY